jgi:hypothetical protein
MLSASEWETAAKVAAALVPAIVAVIGLARGPGQARAMLRFDVELLAKLPDSSAAHKRLLKQLDDRLAKFGDYEATASRDIPMLVVSIVTAPGLAYLAIWLTTRDEWWAIALAVPTATFSLLFLYGIFECAQRVPRDSKGKRL